MVENKNLLSEGSVSEWNEGNFKNLRLHEAQELINVGKVSPFKRSDDSNCWNFELWKAGIDILYGEGNSKYSDEEVELVEKTLKLVSTYIDLKPAFINVTEDSYNGKVKRFKSLKDNQEKIKNLLEYYEKQVKKYNDVHGLSTRNKDDDDSRGL